MAQMETKMEGVELELNASGFTKATGRISSQKSLISRISTVRMKTEMKQKLPVAVEVIVLSVALVLLGTIVSIPTIIMFAHQEDSSTVASQCDSFSDTNQTNCTETDTFSGSGVDINTSMPVRVCSPDFYLDEASGLCLAECGEWSLISDHNAAWLHPVAKASLSLQVIGGVLLLIVSCINYKHMFRYPSIYIIFGEVPVICLGLLLLIGYIDEKSLYCPSRDHNNAVDNPTLYCIIATGAMTFFAISNASLFWLSHVTSVFVAIKFPFEMRNYTEKGYTTVAYVLATIAAPVIAMATVAIQGGTGYATYFLPIGCAASDPDVTYYTNTLVLTVVNFVAGSLLISTIWELMKVAFFHYRMSGAKVWPKHITKAQLKLMVSFVWYMVYGLFLQIAFSVLAVEFKDIRNDLAAYHDCESTGQSLGKECDRSGFEDIQPITLFGIQFVIGVGYPFVNLMYALNIKRMRHYWNTHCHKISTDL